MKILLISTGSGSRGGGELYLVYLSAALSRLGHDVHVLIPGHPRMDELSALFESKVTIHRLNLRNTYDRMFRQVGAVLDRSNQARCRRFIQQLDPDVLHVNLQVAEDGLDILLAINALDCPAVLTIHITRRAKNLGAKFGFIRDWLTESILKKTPAEIITVSNEMQKILARRLDRVNDGRNTLHTVYNGVSCGDRPDAELTKQIRAGWNVNDATPMIGVVGRLEQQKNPTFFIELLAELKRTGVNYKAVWVGDGRLRAVVEQSVLAQGLTKDLVLDGWRNDVMDRLCAMDIFVLPSRFEGLPIALQQAMCAGLPVCVSDVDGMHEAVTDNINGYLCRVNDKDQWLDRIKQLISDKTLRVKMGQSGKQVIAQKFSLASMAENTLHVYHKAVRSHQSLNR